MRKLFPIIAVTFLTSCSSTVSTELSSAYQSTLSSITSPYPNRSYKSGVDYFSSDIYGPFSVGDPDFDAKFTYRADIDNQQIVERFLVCDMTGDPFIIQIVKQ